MGEGGRRDESAVLAGRVGSTAGRETEWMESGAGGLGDSVRLRVSGPGLGIGAPA